MSDITSWYSLLNGRNFRGILSSEWCVLFLHTVAHVNLIPLNSDLDSLTRDYQYASYREVTSFKDAILIMVLKGDKHLLTDVKALSPPLSPTMSDLDHLTISSLSIQDEGMVRFNIHTNDPHSVNFARVPEGVTLHLCVWEEVCAVPLYVSTRTYGQVLTSLRQLRPPTHPAHPPG